MKIKSVYLVLIVFLISTIMFLGFKSYDDNETKSKGAIMRVFEPVGLNGRIVISYGNGESEVIDLKQLNSSTHEHNGDLIVNTMNKILAKGYKLVSVSSSGGGNSASLVHFETYAFSK